MCVYERNRGGGRERKREGGEDKERFETITAYRPEFTSLDPHRSLVFKVCVRSPIIIIIFFFF